MDYKQVIEKQITALSERTDEIIKNSLPQYKTEELCKISSTIESLVRSAKSLEQTDIDKALKTVFLRLEDETLRSSGQSQAAIASSMTEIAKLLKYE